jgi:hypothetical protein
MVLVSPPGTTLSFDRPELITTRDDEAGLTATMAFV